MKHGGSFHSYVKLPEGSLVMAFWVILWCFRLGKIGWISLALQHCRCLVGLRRNPDLVERSGYVKIPWLSLDRLKMFSLPRFVKLFTHGILGLGQIPCIVRMVAIIRLTWVDYSVQPARISNKPWWNGGIRIPFFGGCYWGTCAVTWWTNGDFSCNQHFAWPCTD